MVFANESEHQEPITQQISEKTSDAKLPMFNQNISSLTISITEIVMKKCPFLDKEQVTKKDRITSKLYDNIKNSYSTIIIRES